MSKKRTSERPAACGDTKVPPVLKEHNGYDVHQAALASLHKESHVFRQRMRQWLRSNWLCALLFIAAWLGAGACLVCGRLNGGLINTALWSSHHTLRADYSFNYQVPGSQPIVAAQFDSRAAFRNLTALEKCRQRLFLSSTAGDAADVKLMQHFSSPANWNAFKQHFDTLQNQGIMPGEIPREMHPGNAKFRLLVSYDDERHSLRLFSFQNLPPLPDEAAFFCAESYAASIPGITMKQQRQLAEELAKMLHGNLEANLTYDQELTEVWNKTSRQEQEITVQPGDVLTAPSPEALIRYEAYADAAACRNFDAVMLKQILMDSTFVFSFLGCGIMIFGLLWSINFLRIPQAGRKCRTVLVTLTLIINFAVLALASHRYTSSNIPITVLLSALPLAFFPALITNLLGWRPAVCYAVLHSLMLPMLLHIPPYHYKFFYFALFISLSAIPLFNNLSRRMQFFNRGIILGIIISLAEIVFLFDRPLPEVAGIFHNLRLYGVYIVAPVFNGIGTGILCIIALPLLEHIFNLATPIALHELSDLNSPLLRRLRSEAPGTYEHSLAVADLATNAAVAIGVNARLAYAMSLYHDIGKLYAPRYFAENTSGLQNPHDHMTPQESAAIIREHVDFGVELAKKYHLSQLLMPAITQHHGNSLISFFYNKAKAEAEKSGAPLPQEDAFRYPYPPPASRET
ncbi:MAG: HDIG domain-containing protein, partial [Victivallales bacterium]|nr:HDIG domain-containing protein [Victivallales bacterium]